MFRVAGAVILRFVMSMVEASDAESVEGLQISCHGSVTVTGLRMPRLNFFVAGALLIFKASFLKEVSHKSFVFELQSFIFEGSLAEMLRF